MRIALIEEEQMDVTVASVDRLKRADCYRLLSACFCEPEKEMFEEEDVLNNLTRLLNDVCPDAAACSVEMADEFRKTPADSLVSEYAALFIGPFQLRAPPYGSVYLGNSRMVMDDSTMETLQFYREAGLHHGMKEPPDHIAIELEFMHFLISEEVAADLSDDHEAALRLRSLQNRFLRELLGRWVSHFCSSVIEWAEIEYFRALAGCLDRFLMHEVRTLD